MKISLDEIYGKFPDREREPTARDFLEFTRHYRERGMCGTDHEPYGDCMAWAEMDWGSATARSPRRSPPPGPPEGSITYTATQLIDRHLITDSAIVDRARVKLTATVERWCDTHGYAVVRADWQTNPPTDPTAPVELRLEAVLLPRTDGEWDSIRQAVMEDEADREAATSAKTTVDDRLDALAASVGIWTARGPREVNEALRGAGTDSVR